MLCEEVESLLRQGYCFEYFSNFDLLAYKIRFYKNGQSAKRFVASNKAAPHMLVEDKNFVSSGFPALYPEDLSLIDSNLSRQLLRFVFEYGTKNIAILGNWVGWREKKDISIGLKICPRSSCHYPEPLRLSFDDFKKRESANSAELAEIAFPEEIAPVSEIIREYAEYSLYDFLVENFEKFVKI